MPANSRLATPAQMNYIAALLGERDLTAVNAQQRLAIEAHRAGVLNISAASALINTLSALPRLHAPVGRATEAQRIHGNTEQVATPSFKTRAGRMLQAGGIEASITMPDGQHVTVRVSSRAPRGRGWANCGPSDLNARVNITVLGRKVGWLNVDALTGGWFVTFRTRNVAVKDAIRVMFNYAAGNVDETGNMGAYRVQEANRCGRCFRTLTDPVSIDRGIGPECYGRTTGSHHVRVEANTTATPEPRATAPTATATFRRETIEQAQAFAEASNAVTEAARVATRSMGQIAEQLSDAPVEDEIQAARDLIVEALDAYEGGVTAGMNALAVFDKLARRVAAAS